MKDRAFKSKELDMTVGNPTRHILTFAFPILIGNIFQQLYNMVDSLVVGNFVGANSLAAIGTCGSLNFLFVSLSMGLANGIGIIVSQYYGAKDEKGIRSTIANAYYLIVAASIIATILGFFIAKPVLMLMSTPEEILPEATLYLKTTVCGIMFIALYNSVAAVLRALGDSRTPLFFLIISSFINVFLDLLFVLQFHMGVFGAALATVISQAASATVSLAYAFWKVPYYRAEKEDLKPHKKIILYSFKLGVPMALQSSLISISLIVLQSVVNGFGNIVMAAYTISAKVDVVVSQLYVAVSHAMTTYAGQNYGAGNADRIKAGVKRGSIIVTSYNLLVIPLICIFSSFIAGAFVRDPEVIKVATTALRINGALYFGLGMIYVPRGTLNGCGDAAFSMINGMTEVICRIVYANILTSIAFIGVWGIWWAAGLTWFTTAGVNMWRFLKGPWKCKIAAAKQSNGQ